MENGSSGLTPQKNDSADVNHGLVSAIAELLEIDASEILAHSHLTFVQLGGSSVKALQLTFRLEALDLPLDIESILDEDSSIEVLSQLLKSSNEVGETNGNLEINHSESQVFRQFELLPSSDTEAIIQQASNQIGCSSASIEDILPLTCQQRGLWLGSLKQPGTYVSHWRFAFPDCWDAEILREAWLGLVQQTPALRVRVVLGPDETPYQAIVAPDSLADFWYKDNFHSRPGIASEYGTPLVMAGIEHQKQTRSFHIYAHHALYDRWSMHLMMRDLRQLYYSLNDSISRPSFLPYLKPMAENVHDDLLRQWRTFLGSTSCTPVPSLTRSDVIPLANKTLNMSIEVPQTGSSTKAELITAAWSLVCSKHCNSHDVSFGLTTWGRDAPVPSVPEMAFPTFLTLPFCARFTPGDSVIDLLRKTKSTLGILRRVQSLGIDEIAAISEVSRQVCQFNSIVVVQPELDLCSTEKGEIFGPGELLSWDIRHPLPLLLECTPGNGTMNLSFHYDPHYLPNTTAEHLLSHLCVAAKALSACDETVLDHIDLFAEEDARRINEWVVPCEERNNNKLNCLIEYQAKLTPKDDALWTTDSRLTYAQLVESASRIANRLEARNASGNVGFCLEKSILAIVAMIGINMAGCAFVPLDPSNPPGRLAQLVEDSDMALVLCSSPIAARVEDSLVAVPLLVLDPASLSESGSAQNGNLEANQKSADLKQDNDTAYIIYTSGSTGKPKGVVISHHQVCTSISAMKKTYGFSQRTRALQFSSYSFDACIVEIFVTLSAGGIVCVPSDSERFELDEFIHRSKPNFSFLTPSVALTISNESMAQLSRLVLGGEALSKGVLQKAFEAGTEVWCGYGPTETTVLVMQHRFNSVTASPTNLGYSFSSTAWIVDSQDPHKLAPVGIPGELAFSGHTLASGYYKDAEKTDRAFRRDLKWTEEFPEHPLGRVYLTGDVACYNPDGSIEYLGRSGGYTKIAGNRVDLAEIEHVLIYKGELSEASVQICRINGHDAAREVLLCFFVEPSSKNTNTCRLLDLTTEARSRATRARSILKESLPSYMMPSAFVLVSCIPLAISGKLDKNTLHGLVEHLNVDQLLTKYDLTSDEDVVSMDTNGELSDETETILKDAWAKVLGIIVSSLNSNSNFFLDGDSLQAMRLAAVLRRQGISIRVADIFRSPVLHDMVASVKQSSNAISQDQPTAHRFFDDNEYARLVESAAFTLQIPVDSIESLNPCLSLQIQMLVASENAQGAFFHQECFELDSSVVRDEVADVCRTFMEQNELLRTRMFVDAQTGRFLQVVVNCDTAFTMESLNITLEQYLNDNSTSAMGLETELCRFTLLEAVNRRILVWEMHHSIYDGHSRSLLLKRLQGLIEQRRQNRLSDKRSWRETPNVDFSYQKFVQFVESADKRRARTFWSQYLEGSEPLNFHIFQRVSNGSITNAKESKKIGISWKTSFGFTSATYLRAAFAILLAQYAGRTDVNFAATINGRDIPVEGIESIAGPTFSTIPVRVMLEFREPLRALLSRVQQDSADCLTHQILPTEDISQLSASCKEACNFNCHLLIQAEESKPPYDKLTSLGYRLLEDVQSMALQIPFNLVATPSEHHVELGAIYNDGFAHSRQVKLFLDQLGAILQRMPVATVDANVGDVASMGEMNNQLIMALQPKPNARASTASSIHELVLHNLAKGANREALYSSDISLTYQEMSDLSCYFAHRISKAVKTPNQMLATCFNKSVLGVIAQLSILMAGHAFVPIDPEWPAARREDILQQTQCPLILTSHTLAPALDSHSTEVLILDAAKNSSVPDRASLPEVRASDAAYVIFTSGSTGVAKGVVIQHGSITKTLQEYAERLMFTPNTRALLFASFTFDASVMETWSVLVAGGTLCIADDNERIGDLAGFISRTKCDCIGLTPTAARLIEPPQVPLVKTVLFCGEKCKESDRMRWKDHQARLVNAYGPTETSVNAAMNTRFRETDIDDIGASMGGGLWIVEPGNCDHFLPVGCAGELMISGPVLAREYLNAPQMTARKFVRPTWPDWTQIRDDRAYMTGDLAGVDMDGRLHFIGRNDGQMKIRGVRIEAEEIESAIQQSSVEIKETVAGSTSEDDENEQIALYFVPNNAIADAGSTQILPLVREHANAISNMHETVSNKLPASHVPSVYIPISRVPFSTSGKADRKLLSRLTSLLHPAQLNLYRPLGTESMHVNGDDTPTRSTSITNVAATDAALSETESTLREMWHLAIPQSLRTSVTAVSHFIQVGGDSVAAIRLAAAAKSRGLDLPVNVIYANPVLRDMAQAIEKRPRLGERAPSIQSPGAFELLDGLELSPALSLSSPVMSLNGRDDYFGRAGL